jgi:hypothetical protein
LPTRTGREPAYPGSVSITASAGSVVPAIVYSGCSSSGPGSVASTPCSQPRKPSASAVEPTDTSAFAVIAPSRSQQ